MTSYIQWCNENEARSYPFDDTATLKDNVGAHLPSDLVVDACLNVTPDYSGVYCSSVRITQTLISIAFVHADAPLLVGTFSRRQYAPYTALPLTPMVDNVSGWVTFGSHRSVVSEQYLFAGGEQSALSNRAVRIISAPPVIYLTGMGYETIYPLDRLVKLEGSTLLRIYQDSTNHILFELDPGQGGAFLGPCGRYYDPNYQVPAVRTINGVSAAPDGSITLRFIA